MSARRVDAASSSTKHQPAEHQASKQAISGRGRQRAADSAVHSARRMPSADRQKSPRQMCASACLHAWAPPAVWSVERAWVLSQNSPRPEIKTSRLVHGWSRSIGEESASRKGVQRGHVTRHSSLCHRLVAHRPAGSPIKPGRPAARPSSAGRPWGPSPARLVLVVTIVAVAVRSRRDARCLCAEC